MFCATEDAALRMRDMLVQLNQDMVKRNPDYVVRITGSDEVGKSKLDYFRSTTEKYPVIATTSKLLSTGADIKMTKLIVLDEMIGSMTEFKQILGRGTRLRGKRGQDPFHRDGLPQRNPAVCRPRLGRSSGDRRGIRDGQRAGKGPAPAGKSAGQG